MHCNIVCIVLDIVYNHYNNLVYITLLYTCSTSKGNYLTLVQRGIPSLVATRGIPVVSLDLLQDEKLHIPHLKSIYHLKYIYHISNTYTTSQIHIPHLKYTYHISNTYTTSQIHIPHLKSIYHISNHIRHLFIYPHTNRNLQVL